MRLRNAIALLLIYAIHLGALPLAATAQVVKGRPSRPIMMPNPNSPDGLQFRLSEGKDQPAAASQNNVAPATPLNEGDAAQLLKRLPPVKETANDKQDFKLRDKSLPPPKTGETIKQPFPAPDAPRPRPVDAATNAPLSVVRYAPEGAIDAAPQLTITFSQPMVPITTQDEAAQYVPVRLTPQPKGVWRWLGTRTLLFQPEGRFPMATDYRVTVPAGTKDANGQTLAAEKSWTFSTPPLKVENQYPTGNAQRRDVPLFLSFDQAINPAQLLPFIKVTAAGKSLRVRLATPEEIAADATLNSLSKSAQPNRWLALRVVDVETQTTNALPGDAQITVTVAAGAPSAEGPKVTAKPQSYTFRTYGAFKLVRSTCGYNNRCGPFDAWQLEFSNPIDGAVFKKEWVKIAPDAPNVKAAIYGNTLSLSGPKKGRTQYAVTVAKMLQDVFGQTLDQDATATFNVGAADKSLFAPGGNMVILDPSGPARLAVYTTNYDALSVKLYAVAPSDWWAWQAYLRGRYGYDDDEAKKQTTPPGRLVFDKSVTVNNKPDELSETGLDLSPALNAGLGHVIAVIEPPGLMKKIRRPWERESVMIWAQRTQIGLDAFTDNAQLVAWANSLKDGKPLAGVDLTIMPGGAEPIGSNAPTSDNQSFGEWFWSFFSNSASGPQQSADSEETSHAHVAPKENLTGADGTLRFAMPSESGNRYRILVARKGNDVAFLPENDGYWQQSGSNWTKSATGEYVAWYVFDDRKLYRPNEEVKIKGWLRRITQGPTGDVEALDGKIKGFNYTVRDSQGNEVSKGAGTLNALGGFDLTLKLPPTMNLGEAYLQFQSVDNNYSHTHVFQVQEFRRPEFEVSTQTDGGPYFVGRPAQVTVNAAYYAGGGLANADVNWNVTASPTNYTPPNWDEWVFGQWVPWWVSYYGGGNERTQNFTGKTDAAGKHRLQIDFDSVKPPRPYRIEAQATVQDVNRQAFTSSSNLLVHPSQLYVGLKTERAFVEQGTPIQLQSIVTDIDGKAIAGRDVSIEAVRLDWEFENGSWQQKELDKQTCDTKSTDKGVPCRIETKGGGGRYRIIARVMDDNERLNQTELTVWVSGGKVVPSRNVEQEKVELIPNKKDYQPGETAEILVQAPFAPAEGILTLRREGLVKTQRFTMDKASYTLKIPIAESYLPNITAQVDLVGASARTDDKGQVDNKLPKRPAFANGSLNLSIPPLKRKLSVAAVPRDTALTPGGSTVVNLEVKSASGEPVANSEVAVIVVDESVLALTGYRLADPLATFYPQRGDGVSDYHTRPKILLGNPDEVAKQIQDLSFNGPAAEGAAVMVAGAAAPPPPPAPSIAAPQKARAAARQRDGLAADDAKEKKDADANQPAIALRENFNALAVFAPAVPTDGNGRATVQVKLPDNLTRYRVMAVAVAGGKLFGMGESSITARQPLMVRPSAPRFLNFGDQFELPVVVQNQTDAPMTVDVAVRATNITLTAGNGRRVVVPANDRVEVRFPAAAQMAGTARFQIGVASGQWSDAAEISLPVWTPATTEAFATYGQVDGNGAVAQPVSIPGSVVPQFGGLEVTTSSTQLQELTDAVLYLENYPYGCSEQIASRVLGIAALRDVLTAFKAKELPSPEELKKGVDEGIKRLAGRQNPDGSFGLWARNDYGNEWPFLTLHVTHALARAKAKGFAVPDDTLKNALGYLKNVESRIPKYYSKETRWAISAYALNVRAIAGDKDAAKARKLIAEAGLEKLSLESVGWLLPVISQQQAAGSRQQAGNPQASAPADPLVESIRRLLANRAVETAGAAHFVTSYTDGAQFLLHSDRRADGIILEALIGDQPNNDLIPKIVRGLLANKIKGRWLNTQENVFILLALDKYFNTYEKVEPNFVARIWLGNAYAGEQAFKGRSTDRNLLEIPMSYLVQQPNPQPLILDKQGAGRLYYRIGLNYAPASLQLAAADYGFKVERIYEAVDKPEDVKRNADGSWRIKAGARVRVRLTMTAPTRRYHVALVDPLPAGLEILNPELATTGRLPGDEGNTGVVEYGSRSFGYGSYWWRANWFEHQNFRDERAEAFTQLLWEGVWNYSYVARATTPGKFVVPPAKAEEMYMPETFGRTATDRVTVE